MKVSKTREEECKKALLEYLKPGDTVYCNLKHVSKSGMYRVIDLFTIKDNQMIRLSGYAADLLEGYDMRHDGCKAHGVGMDMGFHLVYNLGWSLFGSGWDCIGPHCPSNDHVNKSDRDNPPPTHTDGGYALKYRWM